VGTHTRKGEKGVLGARGIHLCWSWRGKPKRAYQKKHPKGKKRGKIKQGGVACIQENGRLVGIWKGGLLPNRRKHKIHKRRM